MVRFVMAVVVAVAVWMLVLVLMLECSICRVRLWKFLEYR